MAAYVTFSMYLYAILWNARAHDDIQLVLGIWPIRWTFWPTFSDKRSSSISHLNMFAGSVLLISNHLRVGRYKHGKTQTTSIYYTNCLWNKNLFEERWPLDLATCPHQLHNIPHFKTKPDMHICTCTIYGRLKRHGELTISVFV